MLAVLQSFQMNNANIKLQHLDYWNAIEYYINTLARALTHTHTHVHIVFYVVLCSVVFTMVQLLYTTRSDVHTVHSNKKSISEILFTKRSFYWVPLYIARVYIAFWDVKWHGLSVLYTKTKNNSTHTHTHARAYIKCILCKYEFYSLFYAQHTHINAHIIRRRLEHKHIYS